MKTQHRSPCFALLLVVFLTAALAVPPAFAGDDDPAIIAATKKYLAAESYPADMKITVEKVEGDYARVATTPKDPKMDRAIAFLKREHGKWKGLTIDTGWDPADLDKLPYPQVSSSVISQGTRSVPRNHDCFKHSSGLLARIGVHESISRCAGKRAIVSRLR